MTGLQSLINIQDYMQIRINIFKQLKKWAEGKNLEIRTKLYGKQISRIVPLHKAKTLSSKRR